MEFEEAKLVYQYYETDYELHDEVATFGHEEAAIQFGVKNLMDNKGKRLDKTRLYALEITIVYDSLDSYEEIPHDTIFWEKFEENYKRIEAEIAKRYEQQNKKVK